MHNSFKIATLLCFTWIACSKGGSDVPPNPCAGVQGPLFTAVRNLIQTNCALTGGCHGDTQQPLYTDPCNIVANKSLIKQRAVDGNPTPMPPTGLLPASERQKITDWINAGGSYSN